MMNARERAMPSVNARFPCVDCVLYYGVSSLNADRIRESVEVIEGGWDEKPAE